MDVSVSVRLDELAIGVLSWSRVGELMLAVGRQRGCSRFRLGCVGRIGRGALMGFVRLVGRLLVGPSSVCASGFFIAFFVRLGSRSLWKTHYNHLFVTFPSCFTEVHVSFQGCILRNVGSVLSGHGDLTLHSSSWWVPNSRAHDVSSTSGKIGQSVLMRAFSIRRHVHVLQRGSRGRVTNSTYIPSRKETHTCIHTQFTMCAARHSITRVTV